MSWWSRKPAPKPETVEYTLNYEETLELAHLSDNRGTQVGNIKFTEYLKDIAEHDIPAAKDWTKYNLDCKYQSNKNRYVITLTKKA